MILEAPSGMDYHVRMEFPVEYPFRLPRIWINCESFCDHSIIHPLVYGQQGRVFGLEHFVGNGIQWYMDKVYEIILQWETYGTYYWYHTSLNRVIIPIQYRRQLGYDILDILAPTLLMMG